jgi:hypothetical protein
MTTSKTKIKTILMLSAAGMLSLMSCKKENAVSPVNSSASEETGTMASRSSSANSFLTFASNDAFYSRLSQLQTMTEAQIESWETSMNFRSMRSAFNLVVNGDEAISLRQDSLSQDSLDYYETQPVKHCKAVTDYAYMLLTVTEENGSFFDANINNYNFASLVNTYGIVKIGTKIYQFTKTKIKTIDDGDSRKIPELIAANESIPTRKITVLNTSSGYLGQFRISSTATFVRSAIGNSGRHRTIVYQNWDQVTSTSQTSKKVSTYKIRVRSLVRRLRGAWYDNKCRNLSLSGNVTGNSTTGQLANGTTVTIGWSFGVSNSTSGPQHTWDYFLPNKDGMNQTSATSLVTEGTHPQIYSSSITGNASGGTSATTTYP